FARSVKPAPMPVVGNQIVNERAARSRTLPQVIIKPFGNWCRFTVADGYAIVHIPTTTKICFADKAAVDLWNDFAHGCGRTALRAHLHNALIFFYRSEKQFAFVRILAA